MDKDYKRKTVAVITDWDCKASEVSSFELKRALLPA